MLDASQQIHNSNKFYVFIFSWLDVSVGATQYFELKDDDDELSQLPRWLQFFVGTAGDRRIIHAEWWILSMSSWFRYVGFIRGVSISNIHYLEVISFLDVLGMQRMKSSRTTVEYIPSAPPLFQFGDWRKMDPEVGKAHHMRVAYRRHYIVGAIPGRQYYAWPLSLPLTHPQPC